MGRCRNCNGSTHYKHNSGWCKICFYFNYKEPRMYIASVLTLFILYLPLIDENGLRGLLMKTLFESTGWIPFHLAYIFISSIAIVLTYTGISKGLYKHFK